MAVSTQRPLLPVPTDASTILTTDTLAGRAQIAAIDNQHSVQGISPAITTVAGFPSVRYNVVPIVPTPEVGSPVLISAQLGDRYHNAAKSRRTRGCMG